MKVAYIFCKITNVLRGKCKLIKHKGRLKLGRKVAFERFSLVRTYEGGIIKIADSCHIGRNTKIASIGGELSIGSRTYFNQNVTVVCKKNIQIGNNCAVGPGVIIYDHDHKFGKNGLEKGYNVSEIVIGEHCWIGANVTILRGTHIGKNCVVGAGCVVQGNIPDNTLITMQRELVMRPLK